MAAEQNASDKNLPASPRKLQKAREEGQVARSRDLGHFGAIAAGGAVLVAVAPTWVGWLQNVLAQSLRFDRAASLTPDAMTERLGQMGTHLLWVVIPLGALMAAV